MIWLALPLLLLLPSRATAECLANATLNAYFAGDGTIPKEGSCCMFDVCGLACPTEIPPPAKGACRGWAT